MTIKNSSSYAYCVILWLNIIHIKKVMYTYVSKAGVLAIIELKIKAMDIYIFDPADSAVLHPVVLPCVHLYSVVKRCHFEQVGFQLKPK